VMARPSPDAPPVTMPAWPVMSNMSLAFTPSSLAPAAYTGAKPEPFSFSRDTLLLRGTAEKSMSEITIERVDHIGIRVRDLDRAMKFYDALGFKLLSASTTIRWRSSR